MIDLSRYPKTTRVLETQGIIKVGTKLFLWDEQLSQAWRVPCEQHLRGARKEHKQRQEFVRHLAEKLPDPETLLFLGWVLLTDSWRHVRAEAVHVLARHPTEPGQAFLALALADRSQLVVRAARAALKTQGGLTAFLVLVALWEERGAELDVVQEALVGLARRVPQPGMRAVLPRLEQESRRFFILPRKRRQLRELIETLDQATAHLKDLPLTVMSSVEAENLPLPSELPKPSPAELPESWVRRVQRWFRS